MVLIQHLSPHRPKIDPGTPRQYGAGREWQNSGDGYSFPIAIGSGNILLAAFVKRQSGTLTPPVTIAGGASSWTQTDTVSNAYMYYGVSNGSSQNVTVTGLSQWQGIVVEMTNMSSTMTAHADNSGTGTSQTVTINVPVAGQLVVVWRCRTTETQYSNQLVSTGWSHIGDPTANSNNGVEVWYRTAPSAGNMTVTWTSSGSIGWAAFAAAFAP